MPLWAWVLLSSLGFAVITLVWHRLRRRSRLLIDDRGILDPSLGVGWIRWDEIEGAYPPAQGEDQAVRIRVRLNERLAPMLRPSAASPETSPYLPDTVDVRLDLSGTGLGAVELVHTMLAAQRSAGPIPSPSLDGGR